MTRNTLALIGIRQFIKKNPDKHDQQNWISAPLEEFDSAHTDNTFNCGTSGCVAGWTVLLNGDKPISTFRTETSDTGQTLVKVFDVQDGNGLTHSIRDRAAEVLGLSRPVSSALFQADNKREHLLKALSMLVKGKTDDEVIKYLRADNDILG